MVAPEPERGVVLEPEREEIVGVVDEDAVPDEHRPRLFAFVDGAQRLHHQPLARRRATRTCLGFGHRLPNLAREEVRLESGQQITPQAVRHGALGIGREHRLAVVDRVEAELEIAPDGRIVGGERFGGIGADLDPVGVAKHESDSKGVLQGVFQS